MKRINALVSMVCIIVLLTFVFSSCTNTSKSNTGDSNVSEKSGESVASDKVTEWDWVLTGSLDHPVSIVCQQYAEEINKLTNGRLKITLRAMGEMPFSTSEYIRSAGDGSVQMANGDLSAVGGDFKTASIIGLPFLIKGTDELTKAINSIKDPINAEIGQYGAQLLMYFSYPQQQIWGSGDAPASMADLKGKKIRSQGSEQSEVLKMMGIAPVSIAASEVATSLSRRVADGLVTAGISMTGNAWYEYVNWGYKVNLQVVPSYIVVNKDELEALPEDIRKIVIETADRYSHEVFPQQLTAKEDEAFSSLKNDHGIEIVEMPDSERTAITADMGTYWANWAKTKGGTTPDDLNKVIEALDK